MEWCKAASDTCPELECCAVERRYDLGGDVGGCECEYSTRGEPGLPVSPVELSGIGPYPGRSGGTCCVGDVCA